MNYRQMAGAIVALVMMCGAAGAQDGPPTDYAEQTVTFGFHNRGSNHWAGAVSAACAGLTGLQNPLNDKVDPAQPAPDLRVTIEGTKIPWNFPSDAVFELRVTEIRTVRGPIKLTLFNKDGSRINDATGKPVELTKAGDSYSAYDDNGLQVRPFVARIQADAETKADAKGNAGGHAILTAKVKPHVDLAFSNPAFDSRSVDVVVQIFPRTATLTAISAFTIERERTRWQNLIAKTTATIEQVNAGDLTQWRIPAVYWYGDPETGELCHGFQAPYRIVLQARFTLNGQVKDGKATRMLTVRLNNTLSTVFLGAQGSCIPDCTVFKQADNKWALKYVVPTTCFTKSTTRQGMAEGQYKDLAISEEDFHDRQWCGEVGYDKGGYGDLYVSSAVEYCLDPTGNPHDGIAIVSGYPDRDRATADAQRRWNAAVSEATTHFKAILKSRRCFLEQKAKAEIGWKEAYTYPCAYPECGANPDPVPTPWR